jgi:hypothetical protein
MDEELWSPRRYHYRAGYQERILIAELSTAPPAVVIDWLKANCKEPRYAELLLGDEDGRRLLEHVLVKRGDRAINIAVAKYGHSTSAIQKAANNSGAAGVYAAANNWRGGPRISQRDFILRQGKEPLLRALLQNKFLPGDFIEALLARQGAFVDFSDDRFLWIVISIAGNERLNRRYEGRILDGYAEYRYHKPFDAAWGLVKTVPVDREWASALSSLLERTQPATSFDGVTQALERWRIDEPLPKPVKWYKREPSFHLRSLIANRLQADKALLGAEDAALRMSFYRRFEPSGFPTWPDFFAEDGEEFFQNVVENTAIWSRKVERERLSALAWMTGKGDSSLDQVNTFRAVGERMRAQFPDWFKDDDSE